MSRCYYILLLLYGVSAPAFAQEATQGDPGQGTGPVPPNVAPNPTPICTDRPTKAFVACTVPKGDFQIESDLVNWTRMNSGDTRVDTLLYTSPTFKYGLTQHTDIEVTVTPYETIHTRTDDGEKDTVGGFGDIYLRLKEKLTADTAKTQISIIPYVKAPTARSDIGNGKWEGGVIVPVNIPLPAKFTLTLGPEIDILANDDTPGYHIDLVSLVNLSHPIGKKLNVYAEFWNSQSLQPDGTVHEYSADVAVSYQLTDTLQMDLGANLGLNAKTPGKQIYMGVSSRF